MKKDKIWILLMVIIAAAIVVGTAVVAITHGTGGPASATGDMSRDIYFWLKNHMSYPALVLLMAMESSVIPLPSEVVVPPAAYFALQQGSELNIVMVIVMATVGAYLGSIINYGVSVLLGRPIIYAFADSRVGHMLRLSHEKLDDAESFFQRKGAVSIFVARLLPVVRHLISIPAGLARMNFATFSFYTVMGAGLWNIVLAALGYLLYLAVPDDALFFDQLEHYSHYMKLGGFVLLALVILYIIYRYRKNKTLNT